MKNKNFAVFILTHERSDNVITYQTLLDSNYTGKIYFIIDNEDSQIEKYKSNFGAENVIVFDKKAIAQRLDEGNNFNDRRAILYARNACFDIAKNLGIVYFIQLDDDYTAFDYRLLVNGKAAVKPIRNLDSIFDKLLDFYKSSDFRSVAFAQGGDFIGGLDNGKDVYRFSKRKCMNTFICSTERPFRFVGNMNEDVNTYTSLGSRGDLFLTIPFVSITQKTTQKQAGGITDFYLRFGTYSKSFTSVMMQPSSVKVSMMRSSNPRLHHKIMWENTVPKIIQKKYKKLKLDFSKKI